MHATEAPRLSNSQNSKISFGYVDVYAKSFLILYPSLENSTTPIAITNTVCSLQLTCRLPKLLTCYNYYYSQPVYFALQNSILPASQASNAAQLSFFCCYWETKAKIALMASIYTWESGSGRISNKRLLSCLAGLFDIIQIPQWHIPEELGHAVLESGKRKENPVEDAL